MNDKIVRMKLHYCCRENLYQSMIEVTKSSRTPDTVILKLYRAFALLFNKNYQDALDILVPLQKDPVTNLGSILATIQAQRNLSSSHAEEITHLENTLRNERKKADDESLYFAALFLHFCGRQDKAREYADRMLAINPNNLDGINLRGWIEIGISPKMQKRNPGEYFEKVLSAEISSIEAVHGKITNYIQKNHFSESMEIINEAISTFPLSHEFLIEKLRAYLAAKDWDAVSELSKKIKISGSFNIKLLEIQILATICYDGSFVDAIPLLKTLLSFIEKYEPTNGKLYISAARLFSQVCGRHLPILTECQLFVERALHIDEKNSVYLTELAHQQLLQGSSKDSLITLREAGKLSETPAHIILLKIQCMIDNGEYDDAQEQLDILEELEENIASTPTFLFVKASFMRHQLSQKPEATNLLFRAYKLQMESVELMTFGVDYFSSLNPDFLLSLAEEYFHHSPENSPHLLQELVAILSSVVEACPGLLPALYRLANVYLMVGDLRAASTTLHHVIDHVDPTFIEAYLLMARIGIQQNNPSLAAQYLELGLSYNFQARDYPLYHLLLAQIQRQRKENDAALASLQAAMDRSSKMQLSQSDKATAYLELFHVLMAKDKKDDAGELIRDALAEMRGSPQEGSLLLAHADYLLDNNELDVALEQLKLVPHSHTHYMKAHEKMADIYLNRLKDEQLYLNCYREIARQEPTLDNLSLLGDAYLALHQVEAAIAAYEEALKIEPRHSQLASKIGRALVLTHQYTKALNYYKDALKESSNHVLRNEYASLLLRLGHLDKAEKVIQQSLLMSNSSQRLPIKDHHLMAQDVRNLILMAKLQEGSEHPSWETSLLKAQELVTMFLKQLPTTDQAPEMAEMVAEQKGIAASVATQLAGRALLRNDTEGAIRYYREALTHLPDDINAMAQLAKVYLAADNLEHCQHMCRGILKIDGDNENAMIMVAQIALHKNDLETALLHFQQALQRQPCNFDALHQFIDVCRRRGAIDQAESSLKAAENSSIQARNDPGLSFCQGIYEYHCGQHNAALLALNRARGHSFWGQKAIRYMLDVCLNAENTVLENLTDIDSQYEVEDTELMALHTAAKLLQELKPIDGDIMQTHLLYPSFYLMATRQKFNIERALLELSAVAAKNVTGARENPAIVFGMATGHLLTKQNQRARTQLKRVVKSTWTLQESDYLEKCWLLLADMYIQSGKLDVATDLLRRVVVYNRSCAKAFEYLGMILEKEQAFKEAAVNYENAWDITNRSNNEVGFKLAHNYLKSKQYTQAIDVSQAILGKYPDHPRIRKDILDKAISHLRS